MKHAKTAALLSAAGMMLVTGLTGCGKTAEPSKKPTTNQTQGITKPNKNTISLAPQIEDTPNVNKKTKDNKLKN